MIIAGAGGLALQLIPSLERLKLAPTYQFYIDEQHNADPLIEGNYPIIRGEESLRKFWDGNQREFIVAIGGSQRESLYRKLCLLGGRPKTLIDSSSTVSHLAAEVGEGVIILQDVIVEPGVYIGEGCLVNLRSLITHRVQLGRFVEVSPGVQLLGNSCVGDYSFIGAGAVILPGVKIGKHCIVGAGAVVIRDVDDYEIVGGVPAKQLISK
jgi:sugar O-acyltransferase (sialic acid O-acetyltransferase NeuD family)